MKKLLALAIILTFNSIVFSQNVDVIITVDWPQWSTENKVELYSPTDNLLQTLDNGFDGSGSSANPYNETTTSISYPINASTTAGYYIIVYDTYGDGWNGNGSITITADGENALTFNGSFNTSANNSEISQTIYFALQKPIVIVPIPEPSVFDTSGNEYIEYIPGNIPIIISAPHGGVKLSGQTIGGTFYPDNDSDLPDRNCGGTNERDDNTEILIREIQQSVYDQTGCYPYIIINNLHRSKLDPNRESSEATCGDSDAMFYWNAYHNFIDTASASVVSEFGKGLYIDLHGQSHSVPRIEAGYNISASDLNNNSANHLNSVSNSTISNLITSNIGSLTLEELVRGPNSLGGIFRDTGGTFYNAQGYSGCSVTSGYRTLPSDFNGGSQACDDTKPNSNAYFDGDFYSNKRHGSGPPASDGLGGGGTIDGIMTEVNRRVRDLGTYQGNVYDTRPQTLVPFADDYATVIVEYINQHYNDFSDFNYASATYETTDPDPTPIINGIPGGSFSSTSGLTINASSGIIDVSSSTPGNYTVTYNANGTCLNSKSVQVTINAAAAVPDFAPIIFSGNTTITGASGIVDFRVLIGEFLNENSNGISSVELRIPKNSQLTIDYKPNLTSLNGAPVTNNDWTYDGTNPILHKWTYVGNGGILTGNSAKFIGINATYNSPDNATGSFPLKTTVRYFSGGELVNTNNDDLDYIEFFNNN